MSSHSSANLNKDLVPGILPLKHWFYKILFAIRNILQLKMRKWLYHTQINSLSHFSFLLSTFSFYHGKLKFKIKNHRITTKTEFLGPTHKLIGKKNLEQFWSKFAPPKFLFVEYHRVTLQVMTISCKTKLLFVAAAFKIKNLIFTFLILISPYVWTQEFLIKFTF